MRSQYPEYQSAFAQWCRRRRMKTIRVVTALGRHTNTVYRYLRAPGTTGHSVPKSTDMKNIYAMTEGAVEPNDFYPLEEWDKEIWGETGKPS